MQALTQITLTIKSKFLDFVRGFDAKNLDCEEHKEHPQIKEITEFFKARTETGKTISIGNE